MTIHVDSLWRYPVKGFTPEPLGTVSLEEGGYVPHDRSFAIEVGDSGFDPASPAHISKMRFAVLARFAAVARLTTRFDEGIFHVEGHAHDLRTEAGRASLARQIEPILAAHEDYDPAQAPLQVLTSPPHRFMDSPKGFVSFLNLNSLRDLSGRLGVALDPKRLRANIWLEGLAPFADHDWAGMRFRVGGVVFEGIKPIVRCVATHVNPDTAERDVDVCTALWEQYGHRDCGLYARVIEGGDIRPGDEVTM